MTNPFDLTAARTRALLSAVVDVTALDDPAASELLARVVWNTLAEPGDGTAGALVAQHGAHRALTALIDGRRLDIDGLPPRALSEGRKRWMPRLRPEGIEHALRIAEIAGVRLLTPRDPQWPRGVDDLGPHAPLLLWARGSLAAFSEVRPAVAMVGSRAASSYGELVAGDLAADLAGSGVPIVSGGAYGIDGAAHHAALAAGGTTVALMAGGVDRAYPAGHDGLIGRIVASGGLVLSEVPCGSAPTKWRFLARNRLIAAVSEATVVVEAGPRSGSLNTAGHAAALGRALGAVPGPVTSVTSTGCHRLLREYGAICVTSADDVRELVGLASGASAPAYGEDPMLTRVRDALSTRAARNADEVARRAGLSSDDAEAQLGLLALLGDVRADGGGWLLSRG